MSRLESEMPFKIAFDLALSRPSGEIIQPSNAVARVREIAYQADFVARRQIIIDGIIANNKGR